MVQVDVNQETAYKMKQDAYGYKYAKNGYLESEEYKREVARIERLKLPEVGSMKVPKTDLKKMQNEVTKFFMNTFKGLDFSVLTMSTKKYFECTQRFAVMSVVYGEKMDELIEELLKLVEENCKKGSIFSLPISLEERDLSTGGDIKKALMLIGDEEYLKNVPIPFVDVNMGKNLDRLSNGTYAHEITHGLLQRNKGSVENLYHGELLSIFMEKVTVDNFDKTPNKRTLKISEAYRLRNIQREIGRLNNPDIEKAALAMQYVLGGLTAGVMFDKYQRENEQGKRRMLANVKTVLAGNKTLEQMLEEEQISLDGGSLTRYVDKVEGYAKEFENERVK